MRAKSIRRLIQLLLLISIPCAATTWELSKADKNHLSFQLRECKADDIARYNPPFQTPNSCFLVLVTNHARHKIKWSAPAPYLPATHFFAESGAEITRRVIVMGTLVNPIVIQPGQTWTIANDAFEDYEIPKAGRYRMVMDVPASSTSPAHEDQIWLELPKPPVIPQQISCCRYIH